ncbi:MAG TPA: 3'(2'),5'-bisphosphate nucleotidase CysQ, partial [Clostridia bacterium]|nr:3'(2'),5'-bisphosphate nucleotidase CysQ [Clostridia bacterium]
PVTEADRASNSIISNYLMEKYPEYAILAEETYDKKTIEERVLNPYCLIIDPLDGTKEFIKKNDEFSINIALAYKKRAVCGMIYIPVFNKVYYAARGHGAYKSTSKEFFDNIFDDKRRISVSGRTERLICMHSKSSFENETKKLLADNMHKIEKLVSKGSAIKMCTIAEGKADVYYRYGHTMEWDTAAGQIIIEEAGGIMRQLNMNQTELLYNRYDSCNRNGFYVINNINSRLV